MAALITFLSRRNIQCTLIYFCSYIWYGLTIASFGPSLRSLARQVSVSLEDIALMMTTRSVCYMLGTLAEFVIRNRIDPHKLLVGMMIVTTGMLVAIPGITSLLWLCVISVPMGLLYGLLDTQCNSLIFRLHEDEKVDPFVQALHLCFGLGSMISPFFVGIVLENTDGNASPIFYGIACIGIPIIYLFWKFPTPTSLNRDFYFGESNFGFAFSEVNDFSREKSENYIDATTSSDDTEIKIIPFFKRTKTELLAIFLTGIFLLCVTMSETSIYSFISSFAVVSPVAFSEVEASDLTGAFWTAFTFGRFLIVFMSMRYSSLTIMIFGFSFMALGQLIGLAVGSSNASALWCAVVIQGVGISPLFAGALTFCKVYLDITADVSAIFIAGAAIGEVIGALGTVYLFEVISPKAIWWVCLGGLFGNASCSLLIHNICTPKGIDLSKNTDDILKRIDQIDSFEYFDNVEAKALLNDPDMIVDSVWLEKSNKLFRETKSDPDFFEIYQNPNYDWEEYEKLYVNNKKSII